MTHFILYIYIKSSLSTHFSLWNRSYIYCTKPAKACSNSRGYFSLTCYGNIWLSFLATGAQLKATSASFGVFIVLFISFQQVTLRLFPCLFMLHFILSCTCQWVCLPLMYSKSELERSGGEGLSSCHRENCANWKDYIHYKLHVEISVALLPILSAQLRAFALYAASPVMASNVIRLPTQSSSEWGTNLHNTDQGQTTVSSASHSW